MKSLCFNNYSALHVTVKIAILQNPFTYYTSLEKILDLLEYSAFFLIKEKDFSSIADSRSYKGLLTAKGPTSSLCMTCRLFPTVDGFYCDFDDAYNRYIDLEKRQLLFEMYAREMTYNELKA